MSKSINDFRYDTTYGMGAIQMPTSFSGRPYLVYCTMDNRTFIITGATEVAVWLTASRTKKPAGILI